MPNFLFVYRHTAESAAHQAPEELQKRLEKWHAWIKDGLEKGWMANPGDGLGDDRRTVTAERIVMDGPFVEAKDIIGGFSVVRAASIDAAAEIARGCPCLGCGARVEVRPLLGYTMG
jgi:hypothetical protein